MRHPITAQEFEDLYRSTVRDVLGYLQRRTSRDAEDLAAEVYVVVWRRRADLPAAQLRRAWVFGVARTLLVEDRRREHRRADTAEAAAAMPAPSCPRDGGSPTSDVVRDALRRLRPADRELLQLSAWEGLSPTEIATATGVRPATARVRLHRARKALAEDPEIRHLVESDPASPAPEFGLRPESS